ncbi:hypothetical protein AX16_005830 [Volvariella volvacea WC 439]|nr:hypothetical protein AX16_005830 [Volvariella volvacea WC 439]
MSRFKTQLPSYCALLRSKVFPSSPFSDISSPSSSRSGSPDNSHNPVLTHPHPKHKALSRKTSPLPSRHESALPSVPVLSTTSHRERSKSKSTNTTATTSTSGTTRTKGDSSARALARERSRSLSVSLAQEEEARKRAGSAGVSNKKRVLNKEISMSRVFKPKPKTKSNPIDPGSGSSITGNNNNPNLTNSALDRGVSEANGVERTRVRSRSSIRDEGITLVDDTPVKLRPARTKSSSYSQSCAGTSLGGPSTGTTNSGSGTGSNSGMKRGNEPTLFAMDEEEFWNPPGTSGRFPLRSLSVSGDLSDEDFGSGKEGEGGVEKGSFGNASSTAP